MNNRAILKSIITGFAFSALLLFIGRGFLAYRAHGQTSTPPTGQQGGAASDFRHDVEEGKRQVSNDRDAQNNQNEIDNEEDEQAGDRHGENDAIDGEQSDDEIEQEVENEVEQEGDLDNSQDNENGSAASSAEDVSGSNAGD